MPRVVFQTVVATAVVPAAGAGLAGCNCGSGVAALMDAHFSVADVGVAALPDAGFSVADAGFSVAVPVDAGSLDAGFSVADVGPPDDAAFSVAAEPPDAAG